MVYYFQIHDEDLQPVPATVTVTDGSGYGSATLLAGSDGNLTIDTSTAALGVDDLTGDSLVISAPGFDSIYWSGSQLKPQNSFRLIKSKSVFEYVLLGAGLFGLYALVTKKKKVSGFNELSPVAKNVLVIGGVGIAAWLAIKGGLFGSGEGSGAALATAAAAQLQSLSAQGNGPTISAVQAEGYASSLRTAFDDCGTDTEVVSNVFSSMNNTADVLLLVSTYGTRQYKGCFDGDWFSDHAYNLSEALTSELSTSDLASLNNGLASKGIDYKF